MRTMVLCFRGVIMRRYIVLIAFVLVWLLPGLLFSHRSKSIRSAEVTETATETTAVTAQFICVKQPSGVSEMALDDYVLGVVLGEMPASFEHDALKAQAVATRTYTLRRIQRQNKHTDANICTDAACCQAYISPANYLLYIGEEADLEKIKQAVNETVDQVLMYEGNLIESTYFSCSGGKTEDAAAVWGTSVPYLISVSSPGEEESNYYNKQFLLSKEEFLLKLGLPISTILSNDNINVKFTAGGGVDQMEIAGAVFSGTELRALLGLPSTVFELTVDGDEIRIHTSGYGHRVGMSQYGADAMALVGNSYEEILAHYYPGTELTTLSKNQMQAIFDKAGNL